MMLNLHLMKFSFKCFCIVSLTFLLLNNIENPAISAKKLKKEIESKLDSNDPFKSIGIPDINPKTLLQELEEEKEKEQDKNSNQEVDLVTIDDLPRFLKKTRLSERDATSLISRFLLQDDITLKDYGAIYDHSGFDGISTSGEKISDIGTETRLAQRAKSAGTLYVYYSF